MVHARLSQQVRGIFAEALGVDVVEADANFFELGGTSAAAVIVAVRASELLGVDAPLALVFDAPTPASLADALESLVPRLDAAG